MTTLPRTAYVALIGFGVFVASSCSNMDSAPDVVLVGGPIVSPGAAWMPGIVAPPVVPDAIAIKDGRVSAVGLADELRRSAGPNTRIIDLDGRTVLPGLTDNHLHSIGGGPGVVLAGARTLDDVAAALAQRVAEVDAGELIVTNSDWHEGQLAEQRLPYRDDLDWAAPDNPVVVVRGGHEYILNSAALERWSIDEDTPDVPGGRIGRYADGRLNGELVDRAKDLVSLPSRGEVFEVDLLAGLELQYATLNRRGLTSVRHPGGTPEQLERVRRLEAEERLSMRVDFLFRAPRSGSPEAVAEAIDFWPEPPTKEERAQSAVTGLVRLDGVKLGVDGGFEGGLMRDPYVEPWGEAGTFYGLQTVPRAQFFESVRLLGDAGWRVATHAVGDAAIDLVLDAYDAVDRSSPLAGERWVIEHGFIPRPDQFDRMRRMGLAVSAQDHLYLAAPSLVAYWGEDRAGWTTPLRAYLDAEIPVSLGTDAPVVPYDPWWVLHHFTTRETISAGVVGGDQRVSRLEALRAMTVGYAWLTFSEDERGTLDVGKHADLIVTEADYLACPDPCLETMQVDLTMMGGRIVWER